MAVTRRSHGEGAFTMAQARPSATNRLLGYPDDARLLLVNADDFGMYDDINAAVVRSFQDGIVHSTSLMMPCPAAPQAVELLRANPDIPFGVHLSFIRDIPTYDWGPMAPKSAIPSMLDEAGGFYTSDRMTELLERAKVEEVEIEARAQLDAVLATGLRPTHLDWHCLHSGGRADIFDMTLRLAREHGLALRVGSPPEIERVRDLGLPADEYPLLDSFRLDLDAKAAKYAALLRALPVGLTEWAVHPGLGGAASQALDPDGWRVRRTDYDFVTSPEARRIIDEEGIILIGYAPLQAAWRELAA
jgi:predicted glycoside hydrolase/deacetylase ChbG (UPF0249 family)